MVEIKPAERVFAEEFCKNNLMEYKDGITTVIIAKDNNKILGKCIYDINNGVMFIRMIEPTEDFILADSMLRSALFIAANKNITEVFYKEKVDYNLINRLGFVKNVKESSIDITNLFLSCKNCKKE